MPFTEEQEELLAFLRSEQESFYRGDFEAFVDHWHHGPEVRRIISGPQVGSRAHLGWDELLPRFEEGFRQFPQNFQASNLLRWENVQIQMTADMAWVCYDQIAVQHVPDMHVAPMSHEVKIVQKFNGSWKIVCLIVIAPGIRREDVPLIELDSDGRVLNINGLARERLDAHPGLVVSNEHVHARKRKWDAGLQTAIDRAKSRLATNLPQGFRNDNASVVPLGENEAGNPIFCWIATEQERVMVSFDDAFLLRVRLEAAAPTFGLSPAQLKLAELLALGQDLGAAALELGVSINTVRTQVRRMFEKTDTHNQAALLSRLLNSQGPD